MRSVPLALLAAFGLLGAPTLAQTVTTITEPFEASGGVSVGPDGNVYVADFGEFLNANGGTTLYRVTPEGDVSVFATGFVGASGNAFDAEGTLYQSNIGAGRVDKVAPDGTVTPFASAGIVAPVGVTVDAEGNVYNTNCQTPGRISKTTPEGVTTTFATSPLMRCPNGLTIDDDGNLYTANFNNGGVIKITPDGTVSELVSLSDAPVGNGHLTFANGRLYVCNWGGFIYEVMLDGAARVLAGSGPGLADGPADEAQFFRPNGISASVTGDTLYLNQTAEIVALPQIHPNTVRMITGVFQTAGAQEDAAAPGDLGLAPSAPNPFRSGTRIRYTLPRPMPVVLRVYDVLGRAVRTLVARDEAAGPHEVRWDGRSDVGRPLTAGVYLYALESADRRVVRRVTLLD
ncbi:MAG: FlgD immunoglobulin-like domain containing protein [Rhodothermales bacterium]|nr:FlgD immunoglobulin-like domain containing protein [Rhodothermales bacterium]